MFKLRNVIGRMFDVEGDYDIFGRNSELLKNELDYQNDISFYKSEDGDIVIKRRYE